jgi:hypothetical protein
VLWIWDYFHDKGLLFQGQGLIAHKGIHWYHMSHKSLLFWEFIVNVTLSGQRNNEYYSI